MHIVHIASEIAPVAKVGGLADVLLGLCRELSWKGHDIDIIIPKYDCMDSNQVRDMTIDYQDLPSYYGGEMHHNTIWNGWVENLKVYFIDPHHYRHFFHRGCFYGCNDDIERYLYFSRAALEFLYKKGLQPDIIHLHDWQTAVVAPLYNDIYKPLGYNKPKVLFTVHNIEYQGKCAVDDLDRVGLKGKDYLTLDRMQDDANPLTVNLLKGAINDADYTTTVSPTYAREIRTPPGGKGMEAVINKNAAKFRGILNGLDYSYWNPEIDRFIPSHFSSREMPANKKDRHILDNKAFVKKTLRSQLGLEEQYSPMVGAVCRLVPQKGIELIKFALEHTLKNKGQFVLLGSSPIPSINEDFHRLQNEYADSPDVRLVLHQQEDLAHLIYAAADMILVPSIFEPCGLTQMIALKYGAIPIVRKTGGLADTIFDVDNPGKKEEGNGFVFEAPTKEGVNGAIERAIKCWFDEPDRWRQLMVKGMNIDYSWNHPSDQYLELYKQIINKK